MRKILVIEDEIEIAELVALHLRDNGHEVTHAWDGPNGLKAAEADRYDLVILDIGLPGKDGIEVCQTLRQGNRYIPVLMLTARSSELDRVLGLEVGADDYLTTPFSVRELVARVKAIFRRVDAMGQGEPEAPRIEVGPLAVDTVRRTVTVHDRDVHLTAKEFDLLVQFAANPGRVYSRSQLLDQVWGYGHDGYEHTVNSHINRLRAKIEDDPAKPSLIRTVWGVGYRFRDADDAEQEDAQPEPTQPESTQPEPTETKMVDARAEATP